MVLLNFNGVNERRLSLGKFRERQNSFSSRMNLYLLFVNKGDELNSAENIHDREILTDSNKVNDTVLLFASKLLRFN